MRSALAAKETASQVAAANIKYAHRLSRRLQVRTVTLAPFFWTKGNNPERLCGRRFVPESQLKSRALTRARRWPTMP